MPGRRKGTGWGNWSIGLSKLGSKVGRSGVKDLPPSAWIELYLLPTDTTPTKESLYIGSEVVGWPKKKKKIPQEFPGFPVVRTSDFTAVGLGSISSWGTKILQATWYSKKKTTNIPTVHCFKCLTSMHFFIGVFTLKNITYIILYNLYISPLV